MSVRILMNLVTMAVIATTMPANAMTAEAFVVNLDSLPPDSADMAAFHANLRGAMDTMVLYTKALEARPDIPASGFPRSPSHRLPRLFHAHEAEPCCRQHADSDRLPMRHRLLSAVSSENALTGYVDPAPARSGRHPAIGRSVRRTWRTGRPSKSVRQMNSSSSASRRRRCGRNRADGSALPNPASSCCHGPDSR